MLAPGNIYAGSDVDIPLHVDTAAGVDTDPSTIVATTKKPDGTLSTYTYGTDTEITRQNEGDYTLRINANMPGRWRYRFVLTGTSNLAYEGSFNVQASAFVDDAFASADYS